MKVILFSPTEMKTCIYKGKQCGSQAEKRYFPIDLYINISIKHLYLYQLICYFKRPESLGTSTSKTPSRDAFR